MFNWRVCLQFLLFVLLVFWAGVCIKLTYDVLMKEPGEHHSAKDTTNWEQQLYPKDLLDGRQRSAFPGRDHVFDNGYSSRLLDLVYRSAMKGTHDRRRQVEFEQRVAAARHIFELAAAAADDKRAAEIRLVDAQDSVPINVQGAIDAAELVAADDINLARYSDKYINS